MKKWIFAGLLLFFVLAIIIIVSTPRQPSKSKELAKNYFKIYDIGYLGEYNNETGQLTVTNYWFTVKSIGGNATEAYITQIPGMLEDEEAIKELGSLTQGETKFVSVDPSSPLKYSTPPYKFSFWVTCYEAEGTMTCYFSP